MTNLIHLFLGVHHLLGNLISLNKATALKLLLKASKFAKDVFVNFFLYNNNKNFIKKQRSTFNIHTVCI